MMKLWRRLQHWINHRQVEAELAEEMELHFQMKQEELERAGLSRRDVETRARRELGDALRAREEARDVWRWT